MTDFDLLTDPWISVVTLNGATDEIGLLACLERAHTLREVTDQSPPVTFGLYRFVAAVLQTYLPLASVDTWAELWERGSFDLTLIERVRRACAGRLRLFDAEHPFYQSSEIPLRPPKSGDKTVGYLRLEASTGTNVTHFAHAGDADHALCPACCARRLVTLPVFALAGGAGIRPSINGVPPLYVLPRGETLFRTLVLNHAVPPFLPSLAATPDPGPLWARDLAVRAELRSSVGFVESLTWPPRRIRLFPGSGGACSACGRVGPVLVRKMHFAQGWFRDPTQPVWDDPWGAYDLRDKAGQKVRVARRPREGRGVWRDFGSLFLVRHDGDHSRPAIVHQVAEADFHDLLGRLPVHFDVVGLRTGMKAKIFEWQHDSFEFPPALLRPGPSQTIQIALGLAEDVATQLVYALRELHPESQREKKDLRRIGAATGAFTATWERRYWQALEGRFRVLLYDPRLAGLGTDHAAGLRDWKQAIRETGRDMIETALDAADTDADGLRRQVAARRLFYRQLKQIAPA